MQLWQFFALLVVVNSAIWVYFDSSNLRDRHHIGIGPRGWPPHTWAALVFLLWPAFLPIYLKERESAGSLEERDGPPPRFDTEGLTAFAVIVGLIGFAVFAYLLWAGNLRASTLGLVIAAAGVFGGRRTRMTRELESIELGDAGVDQVGFVAPPSDVPLDDEGEPVNLSQWFGPSMASPTQGRAPVAGAPAGAPVATAPTNSSPAPPPPPVPGRAPAAPQVHSPLPPAPAPAQATPTQATPTPAAPAPAAPIPTAPAAEQAAPSHGVPYSPPPAGQPYAPPPAGQTAPAPPAPSAPVTPATPVQSVAPADPRATVALSQAAIEAARSGPASPAAPRAPQAPQLQAQYPQAPQLQAQQPQAARPVPAAAPFRGPAPPAHAAVAPPLPAPAREPAQELTHEPLVPPEPAAAPGTRGPSPTNTAAPGSRAANPYGYAATKKSPTRRWLPLLAGLLVVGALGGVAWVYVPQLLDHGAPPMDDAFGAGPAGGPPTGTADSTDPADGSVAAAETETGAAAGSPEGSAEAAPGSMAQRMREWHVTYYLELMVPVAQTLEEIDFGGLDEAPCDQLQRELQSAERGIPEAPDPEVESIFRPSMAAFVMTTRACRGQDDETWSFGLLQGKRATHRAQELMDQRYQLPGILELELESEIGIERSTESISGRYLADGGGLG